ncbi:MAG: TlpA disulfide reductase family protein [Deferrisomatales bacterium]|nr:TlpA disulfide reductase family protein [Deferrisomatales bacterium]
MTRTGCRASFAFRIGVLALLMLPLSAGPVRAGHLAVLPGEPVPDLEFEGLLVPEDYPRLGLPEGAGGFRLSQVAGEVLVLEFFNKACAPCQRQVRFLEAFHRTVEAGGLRGRVRILAVAVGNEARYLGTYRESRGLTFAIAADPQFDQWQRLGDPGRTPFTMVLSRQEGEWVLSSSHFGVQLETEFLAHTRAALQGGVRPRHPRELEVAPAKAFEMPLDAAGFREAAQRLLARAVGRPVTLDLMTLQDGTRLYRAAAGGRRLDAYARLASREPVCEVCHAVHFLFAFDSRGRLLGFEPVHVTKYGNEEWDEDDNRFFEGRLKGRTMAGMRFDPDVDAVTMATMTSALIFDEVRRSADLVRLLPRP